MSKFNVGDWVRVIRSPYLAVPVGTERKVTRLEDGGSLCEVDDHYFYDHELELVNDKPNEGDIVEVVLRGTARRPAWRGTDDDFSIDARGDFYYIDPKAGPIQSVKVIEKAKPPRPDYPAGTIIQSTINLDLYVRQAKGKWLSLSSNQEYDDDVFNLDLYVVKKLVDA